MADSCGTCRFVQTLTDAQRLATGGTHACRRSPPQVHTNNLGCCAAGWPLVMESDWCGEYQADVATARENERKAGHWS